jgi:hypothetical protein
MKTFSLHGSGDKLRDLSLNIMGRSITEGAFRNPECEAERFAVCMVYSFSYLDIDKQRVNKRTLFRCKICVSLTTLMERRIAIRHEQSLAHKANVARAQQDAETRGQRTWAEAAAAPENGYLGEVDGVKTQATGANGNPYLEPEKTVMLENARGFTLDPSLRREAPSAFNDWGMEGTVEGDFHYRPDLRPDADEQEEVEEESGWWFNRLNELEAREITVGEPFGEKDGDFSGEFV